MGQTRVHYSLIFYFSWVIHVQPGYNHNHFRKARNTRLISLKLPHFTTIILSLISLNFELLDSWSRDSETDNNLLFFRVSNFWLSLINRWRSVTVFWKFPWKKRTPLGPRSSSSYKHGNILHNSVFLSSLKKKFRLWEVVSLIVSLSLIVDKQFGVMFCVEWVYNFDCLIYVWYNIWTKNLYVYCMILLLSSWLFF